MQPDSQAVRRVIPLAPAGGSRRLGATLALALFAASMSLLGGLVSGALPLDGGSVPLPQQIRAGLFALLAAAVGAWRSRRPPAPVQIVLGSQAVRLPRSPWDRRPLRVPYAQIESIVRLGRGHFLGLVIGRRHGFQKRIPARWLQHPRDLETLQAALLEGVARLPDGAGRLRAIARRAAVAAAAGRRPARVTLLLCLGTGLVVAGQSTSPWPLYDPLEMIRLGASAVWLNGGDGWFRLFSAPLLHSSWLHWGLDAGVFWLLGRRLERLVGSTRFTSIALGSLLGGSLLGLARGYRIGFGFSPAVMGMVGGLLVLNLRRGEDLPAPLRTPLHSFVAVIGAIVAIDRLRPELDGGAHIGGLIAGALVALLVLPGLDPTRPAARPVLPIRALAWALVALELYGLVAALRFVASTSRAQMVHRLAASVDDFRDELPVVTLTALELGLLPDATPDELATLRDALDALGAEQGAPHWLVLRALAALEHRLGNAGRAARLWLRVVEAEPDASHFATLALLLQRAAPEALRGEPEGVRLLPARLDADAGSLRLEIDHPAPRGWVLDALIERDAAPLGLLRIEAGPGRAARLESWTPSPGLRGARVRIVRFEVQDRAERARVGPGTRWSWWPADPALFLVPSTAPQTRRPDR